MSRTLVPATIAAAFDLQPATIRSWQHRGLISAVACDVTTRGNLYDLADITQAELATREERLRRDKTAKRVQRSSLDTCAHTPP